MQSSTYRKEYYKTFHWLCKRQEARAYYHNHCAVCDLDYRVRGGWIEVHHLHYRTLWHETMSDLRLLCCHHHPKGMLSENGIQLWRSSYRWLKRMRRTLRTLRRFVIWTLHRKPPRKW